MISIGLSKKRHLPVWKYQGGSYALWDLSKLIFGERTIFLGEKFVGTPSHMKMVSLELSDWYKWYLPISLSGKTVLDVGSGCGETALFFLKSGASFVTCIEMDTKSCNFAERNLKDRDATVINEPFVLEHLKTPHDFTKMDIEGGERELLKLDRLPRPMVVEVHGSDLIHSFSQRLPNRVIPVVKDVVIMWFL